MGSITEIDDLLPRQTSQQSVGSLLAMFDDDPNQIGELDEIEELPSEHVMALPARATDQLSSVRHGIDDDDEEATVADDHRRVDHRVFADTFLARDSAVLSGLASQLEPFTGLASQLEPSLPRMSSPFSIPDGEIDVSQSFRARARDSASPVALVRPRASSQGVGYRTGDVPLVAPPLPHQEALEPGGYIGKYQLLERLGQGAFGLVFTAYDTELDREVAIKILNPTHLTNADVLHRFLQEARTTARISHPGIVTVLDCGQVTINTGDQTAFIAMELLHGESLTERLARHGQLAPADAIEIVRQMASALEAAHRAEVLHRDLKPDNIYLVPDPAIPCGERVKVFDFGLAKLGRVGQTQVESIFGTPRYMSPEQWRSAAQIDARSDIYALGCILFELVTGQTPFIGKLRELFEMHTHELAPRASTLAPAIPRALDDLIAAMLAKDPRHRPPSMDVVKQVLQTIGAALGAGIAARASSPSFSAASFMRPTTLPPPPAVVPDGTRARTHEPAVAPAHDARIGYKPALVAFAVAAVFGALLTWI